MPPLTAARGTASNSAGASISMPSKSSVPKLLTFSPSRLCGGSAVCLLAHGLAAQRHGEREQRLRPMAETRPGHMLFHQFAGDLPQIERRDHHPPFAAQIQGHLMDHRHIAAMAVEDHDLVQAMAQQPLQQVVQRGAERGGGERQPARAAAKIIRHAERQARRHETPAPHPPRRQRRCARPAGPPTDNPPSANAAHDPHGCQGGAKSPVSAPQLAQNRALSYRQGAGIVRVYSWDHSAGFTGQAQSPTTYQQPICNQK